MALGSKKRYVSLEQIARHRFQVTYPRDYHNGWNDAIDEILKCQPADVQEVKHGKWLLEREPNGKPYCFHCSVCDDGFHYISILTKYTFCPNCGAKMDLEEKANNK